MSTAWSSACWQPSRPLTSWCGARHAGSRAGPIGPECSVTTEDRAASKNDVAQDPTGVSATAGDRAGDRRRDCCVVPLELPPDEPCWFCRYLAGTAPYTILERDDITATLVTFEQRGQGHVLVIPIRHVNAVIDLAPDEQWAVMDAVARATRAILGAFDPSGVAVWQNNGLPAHQTVPHVHVHVAGTLVNGGTERGPSNASPRAPLIRSPLDCSNTFRPATMDWSFASASYPNTTPDNTERAARARRDSGDAER
jgi:histidine triad (HIT) family protein